MSTASRDSSTMSPARRRGFGRLQAPRQEVLIALGMCVIATGILIGDAIHSHQPLVLLIIVGAVGAILLRRRRSDVALVLAVAVAGLRPDNRALGLLVMVVLYTIALRAAWRIAAVAAAGAATVSVIAGAVSGAGGSDHGGLWGYAIGSAASVAAAVAVGLYVAAQRRVRDGLHERAERLDRERELLAERAVAQERVRIAQELHDIVAHNVSLIVVQAQALGATSPDPGVSQSADAIAGLGRQAMSEMHTTLKLLRGDGQSPELSPQPSLRQLERLIEQARAAGLEIDVVVEGQPRALAQAVNLSAFRIIQEGLTNVIKHAPGARTQVKIGYRADEVQVTVTNIDGDHGRGLMPDAASDGHGLIGMRERAALFGGTLSTERLPTGYRLSASLPYAASS